MLFFLRLVTFRNYSATGNFFSSKMMVISFIFLALVRPQYDQFKYVNIVHYLLVSVKI